MATNKRDVLRNIEGAYLLDYAIFTGAVRVYVTQGLEKHFASDKNDLHRRMFLLAVFREEYSAYEDLGAMLDALLTHRQDPTCPLLERLMAYRPGEVKLSSVMDRFAVGNSDELYAKLGLGELVPADWARDFPTLDLERALRTAANFFFADCTRSQKDDGVKAFNKLKHGLLTVPKASLYLTGQIDAPGAIFPTDPKNAGSADYPISLYAVPMSDEHLDARLRAIHFVQANLRMIAALWVITKHPDTARARGAKKPTDLLLTTYLTDVRSFLEQVSNAGSPDATRAG